MRLLHLSLTNFRNYERLDLDVPPGVSVFWGDNAQGKSNFLEAVYYLATMRSFRAGTDRDVVAWADGVDPMRFTRIAARVRRGEDQLNVDVVMRADPRGEGGESSALSKRIKINDVPRRAIDAVGTTTAVMFSPQDLQLIEGSPSIRRRYLDVTLSQEDPRYCRGLAHYNRVLIQRNHLLRSIRDRGTKIDEMHFWNEELVEAGSYLVSRRLATVADLAQVSQESYATLSKTAESLRVNYKNNVVAVEDARSPGVDEIRAAFSSRLATLQPREARLGVTLVGPHRDDLTFQLDGHDVANFGSRGQQRTVTLALKFAEMEHLARETEQLPLLLLDDVFSELDAERRERVFEAIHHDQQVLITSADPSALHRVAATASWFRVSRGRIEPQRPSDSS